MPESTQRSLVRPWPQAAETEPMRAMLPHVLLCLFALQPLPFLLTDDALGYAGLWLATGGLAYLLWFTRSKTGPSRARVAAIAVGFLFLLAQLGRAQGAIGEAQTWLSAALVCGALADVWQRVGIRRTWHGWDWLAVAAAVALLGACLIGAPLLFRSGVSWVGALRTGLALGIWFAVTRAAPLVPVAAQYLARLLMAVLLLGSLVGVGRLAVLGGYLEWGKAAGRAGVLTAAVDRLQRAADMSAGLGLDGVRSRTLFRLAGVYAAQGDDERAARVLGLALGFVAVVDSAAWKGPVGGDLHYQTSCWSALTWYPGDIRVRIFASGEPDHGIWPRMRVQVGERIAGEEWVDGRQARPYEFAVRVSRLGRQRLTVTLINDDTDPERNLERRLRVARAEVDFLRIAWEAVNNKGGSWEPDARHVDDWPR